MDQKRKLIAETCLNGAETNTMTFRQIVGTGLIGRTHCSADRVCGSRSGKGQ